MVSILWYVNSMIPNHLEPLHKSNDDSLRNYMGRRDILPPKRHQCRNTAVIKRHSGRNCQKGIFGPSSILHDLLRQLHLSAHSNFTALRRHHPISSPNHLSTAFTYPQPHPTLPDRHHHRVGRIAIFICRLNDHGPLLDLLPIRHHPHCPLRSVNIPFPPFHSKTSY